MSETAKTFSGVAREIDIDPTTLTVAWAGHHAAVAAPIISARNTEQLVPSLKAMKLLPNAEQYAAIETLSPRPAPATDRLEEAVV